MADPFDRDVDVFAHITSQPLQWQFDQWRYSKKAHNQAMRYVRTLVVLLEEHGIDIPDPPWIGDPPFPDDPEATTPAK